MEVEVQCRQADAPDNLQRLLDVASYVATRGRDIQDGDTVFDEQFPVRHAASPRDPKQSVCVVDVTG